MTGWQRLDTTSQPQVLDGFSAALSRGDAVAVLDPTWPAPLRATAHRMLDVAQRDGRWQRGTIVLFTSGSTGQPRAVIRTHESWLLSLAPLTQLVGLERSDVVWIPGPLWSSLSLYAAWHANTVGARTVLRGETSSSATVLTCVSSAVTTVATVDAPHLRRVVLAGEPVTSGHLATCHARGWHAVEYYGAAELSFVGWADPAGQGWRPFPGVQVRVGDDAHLWVRSPYLASGYLGDSPGPFRTREGWGSVGDLVERTAGGYRVVARGGTAISTGGHTVLPHEVEQALATVDGVDGVVVLGVPHPGLGEVVTAVFAGDAGASQLHAAAAGLPSPARPRRWGRLDALPRTSAGKPDRAAVRSDVEAGRIVLGPLR